MKVQTICVLGGTGFVGRHLVTHLANEGHSVKVLTRHPQRHRELAVLPTVTLVGAGSGDQAALETQFAGCDAVIDLVGILKRVYGPEPARRVLTEQFLPVFEEDEIIFPDLPEDEQAEPGDTSK